MYEDKGLEGKSRVQHAHPGQAECLGHIQEDSRLWASWKQGVKAQAVTVGLAKQQSAPAQGTSPENVFFCTFLSSFCLQVFKETSSLSGHS
jgi:hypothetical protein